MTTNPHDDKAPSARPETPTGDEPAARTEVMARAETTARGEATREALIRAAILTFGRDGFNAASTRAIAEAAGVNQALIGYHFGGKPGLYLAALQFIADNVVERIGPLVATIEAELDAAAGAAGAESPLATERAIALLHRFTDAFSAMLTNEESRAWARLILREQQEPSDGFELLWDGMMQRMLGMTTRLVARARGGDAASDRCKLTALTIVGQVLVFRAGRAAVLRQMGWTEISPAGLEAIQARLRLNVTAILQAEDS